MTRQVKWIALWVALGSLVIKEGLFQYMIYVAKKWSLLCWLPILGTQVGCCIFASGCAGNYWCIVWLPFIWHDRCLSGWLIIVKMGWVCFGSVSRLMDRSLSDDMEKKLYQLFSNTWSERLPWFKDKKNRGYDFSRCAYEVDAKLTLQEGHDIGVNARTQSCKQCQC